MTPLAPNPPALVREANSLSQLAGQINAAHTAGEQAIRTGLTFFRQVGAMLVRAKKQIPHGQWCYWLEEEREVLTANGQQLHSYRGRAVEGIARIWLAVRPTHPCR